MSLCLEESLDGIAGFRMGRHVEGGRGLGTMMRNPPLMRSLSETLPSASWEGGYESSGGSSVSTPQRQNNLRLTYPPVKIRSEAEQQLNRKSFVGDQGTESVSPGSPKISTFCSNSPPRPTGTLLSRRKSCPGAPSQLPPLRLPVSPSHTCQSWSQKGDWSSKSAGSESVRSFTGQESPERVGLHEATSLAGGPSLQEPPSPLRPVLPRPPHRIQQSADDSTLSSRRPSFDGDTLPSPATVIPILPNAPGSGCFLSYGYPMSPGYLAPIVASPGTKKLQVSQSHMVLPPSPGRGLLSPLAQHSPTQTFPASNGKSSPGRSLGGPLRSLSMPPSLGSHLRELVQSLALEPESRRDSVQTEVELGSSFDFQDVGKSILEFSQYAQELSSPERPVSTLGEVCSDVEDLQPEGDIRMPEYAAHDASDSGSLRRTRRNIRGALFPPENNTVIYQGSKCPQSLGVLDSMAYTSEASDTGSPPGRPVFERAIQLERSASIPSASISKASLKASEAQAPVAKRMKGWPTWPTPPPYPKPRHLRKKGYQSDDTATELRQTGAEKAAALLSAHATQLLVDASCQVSPEMVAVDEWQLDPDEWDLWGSGGEYGGEDQTPPETVTRPSFVPSIKSPCELGVEFSEATMETMRVLSQRPGRWEMRVKVDDDGSDSNSTGDMKDGNYCLVTTPGHSDDVGTQLDSDEDGSEEGGNHKGLEAGLAMRELAYGVDLRSDAEWEDLGDALEILLGEDSSRSVQSSGLMSLWSSRGGLDAGGEGGHGEEWKLSEGEPSAVEETVLDETELGGTEKPVDGNDGDGGDWEGEPEQLTEAEASLPPGSPRVRQDWQDAAARGACVGCLRSDCLGVCNPDLQRTVTDTSRLFAEALTTQTGQFRWTRGGLVGEGAYGKVYAGLNQSTGELMAVKQLALSDGGGLEGGRAKHLKSLEQEIFIYRRMRHPHIVGYINMERDEEEDTLYIFLEYCSGGSVQKMLQSFGPFSEIVTRVYTKQLLLGLAYLHSQGILHRDIKGGNVLVDRNCIKLADFGASKALQDPTKTENCNSVRGSVFWMAPEVIQGQPYGRKADIWSVGCTVLEMLTAQHPWPQLEQNMWVAIFHIIKAQSGPPIPDHISEIGQKFLKMCFQFDPRDRPTADELLRHPFVSEIEVGNLPNCCRLNQH